LLEHNNINDAVSDDFAARHHSESYLCHYQSCSCVTQDFNFLNLRQKHESNHVLRFHCIDLTCEFFERALKSYVVMNKYIIKYHDDDSLTSISTSLRKVFAVTVVSLTTQGIYKDQTVITISRLEV